MEKIMIFEQNPLTGNWLCHIPNTPQAYYCKTKRQAEKFCDNVNMGFKRGELKFDEQGNVTKIN